MRSPGRKDATCVSETEYGDPGQARHGEILRALVGSELYGLALETGDRDEMGVYIETPESVLGFMPRDEHYVFRTVGEGERSGPDDTDFISYSLAKYLRLATKGNPTALLPLFAPDEFLLNVTKEGHALRAIRSHFLSQAAVHRFLGYQKSQIERMMGQSKRHVPNRPELIEKYGWDVKYGSHALRLGYQGYEIARYGTLSLPMKPNERQDCLAVKRGEVDQKVVLQWCEELLKNTERVLRNDDTPLPPEANTDLITEVACEIQTSFWGWDVSL